MKKKTNEEAYGLSVWLVSKGLEFSSFQDSKREFDAVVIGGGFTGLSIAYHFKKQFPEKNVLVLERSLIGHGSSGRNSGNFGYVRPIEISNSDYIEFTSRSSEYLIQIIKENNIECNLRNSSYLMTTTLSSNENFDKDYALMKSKFGEKVCLLNENEIAERTGARKGHYKQAILVKGVAHSFNPYLYVLGLARVVTEMGCIIYETTEVSQILNADSSSKDLNGTVQLELKYLDQDNQTELRSIIEAKTVFVATNAYTAGTLNFMKNKMRSFHLFACSTPSLPSKQLVTLGNSSKYPDGTLSLGNLFILESPNEGFGTWYLGSNNCLVYRANACYFWNSGLGLQIQKYLHIKKRLCSNIKNLFPQV